MCICFKGAQVEEEKEDLFEVNIGDTIQAHFSTEDSALGDISISVDGLDEADDWVLVKPQEEGTNGYVLTVKVKAMERAPSDWFDIGIATLSHLPWYLKAEDLYSLTKHILEEYNVSSSRPVVELSRLVDNATFVVANNVLSVRVEEGFSVINQIDELLERVFAASDEKVDAGMLQLARSLQRLRRTVTRRVEGLSDATQQQLTVLQGKAVGAKGAALEKYQSTVHNAYFWALERTEQTSEWVRSEHGELVSRLNGLTVRGHEVVSNVTSRLDSAKNTTLDRVNGRIAEVSENVKGLPERAHPYVVDSVQKAQPYISSAIETAGPYVQSLREKAAPVEEWLTGTKEAVEKKYPAVATATQQASHALEEVVGYCTNEQYFNQQPSYAEAAASAVEEEGAGLSAETEAEESVTPNSDNGVDVSEVMSPVVEVQSPTVASH